MPDTAVSIALKTPPVASPGFGSNVSICDGPPLIQRNMHARLRAGSCAARVARVGSHDEPRPIPPTDASRNQSRREIADTATRTSRLAVDEEFVAIDQSPQDVGQAAIRIARRQMGEI